MRAGDFAGPARSALFPTPSAASLPGGSLSGRRPALRVRRRRLLIHRLTPRRVPSLRLLPRRVGPPGLEVGPPPWARRTRAPGTLDAVPWVASLRAAALRATGRL